MARRCLSVAGEPARRRYARVGQEGRLSECLRPRPHRGQRNRAQPQTEQLHQSRPPRLLMKCRVLRCRVASARPDERASSSGSGRVREIHNSASSTRHSAYSGSSYSWLRGRRLARPLTSTRSELLVRGRQCRPARRPGRARRRRLSHPSGLQVGNSGNTYRYPLPGAVI